MKTLEQIQRLVIDCILAGMRTEVAIRSHVSGLGVSPTEVIEALEELERKIWIVAEPGPLCKLWRVMPIGSKGAEKLPPFHAEIQVLNEDIAHLEACLAASPAQWEEQP